MSRPPRRRRIPVRLLSLCLAALLLTACGRPGRPAQSPENGQRQEITVNIGAEPRSLDPAMVEEMVGIALVPQLFEGLTDPSPDGPVPALAESWKVSADGRTYIFHLRQGRWSNGDPVTAGDFEFAWKRVLDPATASPYAHILYPLAGAEAYNAADAAKEGPEGMARLREAVGVKALDDRTLRVTLAAPTPYFLDLTGFAQYRPVNRRAVAAAGSGWASRAETLVGNGPFRLAGWKPGSELVLERNPAYRDAAAVRLDRIKMVMIPDRATSLTLFENGELDLVMPDLVPPEEGERLAREGKLHQSPLLSTNFFTFNTTRGPLRDARVRRALALALDRRALAEVIGHGLEDPATAMVPPGIRNPATGQDFRGEGGNLLAGHDPAEAGRLLAEAGYPGGKGFPQITLLYAVQGNKQRYEAVQQMWERDLGLPVRLEGIDFKAFLDRLHGGNFDIAALGWVGDYPDPLTFLDLFASDNGMNPAHWKEPAFDDLIRRSRTTVDPGSRMGILHEAESLLLREMPAAPMTFSRQNWLQRADLEGVRFSSLGILLFKQVRLGGGR